MEIYNAEADTYIYTIFNTISGTLMLNNEKWPVCTSSCYELSGN